MTPFSMGRALRALTAAAPFVAGVLMLFLMYHHSAPPSPCYPRPAPQPRPAPNATPPILGPLRADAPLLLLWSWPEGRRFDLRDCERLFAVDGCRLSDDRSLYQQAAAVLFYHRALAADPADLPAAAQRPRSQTWIWFNADPPAATARVAGLERLFNLTLGYRAGMDISARPPVTLRGQGEPVYAAPEKTRLLCQVVGAEGGGERGAAYQRELARHLAVETFASSSDAVAGENYYHTVGSCKFVLSFEASAPEEHISEAFTGPLSASAVPVVLGPPRRSYERVAPPSSFIHVDDFPDAAALARFLLELDRDRRAYMQFFQWRRFHTVRRHPGADRHKFAHAICQACRDVGLRRQYRVVPDLYKWFFGT